MNSLSRLVYVSTRAPGLSDDQIVDDIVLPSIAYNRSVDITGCLWFSEESFLQVLEGGADEIEALYGRIKADARHYNVTTLQEKPIFDRSFQRFQLRVVTDRGMASVAELVANTSVRPDVEQMPDRPILIERAICELATWGV